MARLLVTIGTDGVTDWVRLPTGERLNLGSISMLSFVSKLVGSRREAKSALDAFLAGTEAMVPVDENRMWSLLAPVRARWASDITGPFMTPDPRTREGTMSINEKALKALETHVSLLNKAAGKASPKKMEEGRAILMRLASSVVAAEDEQKESQDEGEEQETDKEASLSFDTYKANAELAGSILAKAEKTVEKIERLASAGKKFNAAKAKADVRAVTTKVAGILREVDLTKDWVKSDLQKLAAQTDKLHGLFAPAKV